MHDRVRVRAGDYVVERSVSRDVEWVISRVQNRAEDGVRRQYIEGEHFRANALDRARRLARTDGSVGWLFKANGSHRALTMPLLSRRAALLEPNEDSLPSASRRDQRRAGAPRADAALIAYTNDPDVAMAFEKIERWHA